MNIGQRLANNFRSQKTTEPTSFDGIELEKVVGLIDVVHGVLVGLNQGNYAGRSLDSTLRSARASVRRNMGSFVVPRVEEGIIGLVTYETNKDTNMLYNHEFAKNVDHWLSALRVLKAEQNGVGLPVGRTAEVLLSHSNSMRTALDELAGLVTSTRDSFESYASGAVSDLNSGLRALEKAVESSSEEYDPRAVLDALTPFKTVLSQFNRTFGTVVYFDSLYLQARAIADVIGPLAKVTGTGSEPANYITRLEAALDSCYGAETHRQVLSKEVQFPQVDFIEALPMKSIAKALSLQGRLECGFEQESEVAVSYTPEPKTSQAQFGDGSVGTQGGSSDLV